MRASVSYTATTLLLALVLSGCTNPGPDDSTNVVEEPPLPPLPAVPLEAGQWNGTVLTMRATEVENSFVRYVRFASSDEQRCESSYRVEGTIAKPWTIGADIAFGDGITYYAHDVIREGTANAEVAGTGVQSTGSEFPKHVSGTSTSTITLQPREEITYYVAVSFPPDQTPNPAGTMEFEVSCPSGMEALETGWSTTAHLLSDMSMDSTWTSVHVENAARIGATPLAEWEGQLPNGSTMFLATEPLAGVATLSSPSGEFRCGPASGTSTARGRVLCMHEFDGGQTMVEINHAPPGRYGQSGTADSWMGLLFQMEYHTWSERA